MPRKQRSSRREPALTFVLSTSHSPGSVPTFVPRLQTPAIDTRWAFAKMNLIGVFVYRLGHGPLKAERRVRFPYALPL